VRLALAVVDQPAGAAWAGVGTAQRESLVDVQNLIVEKREGVLEGLQGASPTYNAR
jgi:hypothetical protein